MSTPLCFCRLPSHAKENTNDAVSKSAHLILWSSISITKSNVSAVTSFSVLGFATNANHLDFSSSNLNLYIVRNAILFNHAIIHITTTTEVIINSSNAFTASTGTSLTIVSTPHSPKSLSFHFLRCLRLARCRCRERSLSSSSLLRALSTLTIVRFPTIPETDTPRSSATTPRLTAPIIPCLLDSDNITRIDASVSFPANSRTLK